MINKGFINSLQKSTLLNSVTSDKSAVIHGFRIELEYRTCCATLQNLVHEKLSGTQRIHYLERSNAMLEKVKIIPGPHWLEASALTAAPSLSLHSSYSVVFQVLLYGQQKRLKGIRENGKLVENTFLKIPVLP